MVAVAADQGAQVLFGPVVEQQVVIIRALAGSPAVKGLVHHEHPHPVAQIEQFRRRRIVTRADRVAAHLLQQLDLPLQRTRIDGGAQRSKVVVIADTVDPHVLPVEEESLVGIEPDRANPERGFIPVHNPPPYVDRRDGHVSVRMLKIPKPGLADRKQVRPRRRPGIRRIDLHDAGL